LSPKKKRALHLRIKPETQASTNVFPEKTTETTIRAPFFGKV